jgi:tetratricopeptide (TPR) repeat protein
MKFTSTFALGMALALGGVTVAAAPALAAQEEAQPERKFNFSEEARPALAELSAASQAGDAAAFQAALAKAQAAAQNSDDRYVIAQFQLNHAIQANNEPGKLAAIEAMIQSGGATQAELPTLYSNLGAISYNSGDYAKAAQAFKQLLQLQPDNKDAMTNLAAALSQQGNPAEAAALVEQRLAAAEAAGQTPPEGLYKQALAMAYEARSPKSIELSRKLVAAYPTAQNWRDTLMIYRDLRNPTGDVNLDLMRLMRATKSLNGERDYYELAEAANSKGLPGEAKAVLDAGIAAKVINPSQTGFKELLASASDKVQSDRASLPGLEKQALAASDGKLALGTGDAYYGYGDYAKAASLYRAALEKGSVDANLANTRLGMALALAGQKAEAEAAFKAVTGPRAELAGYWLLWLSQNA